MKSPFWTSLLFCCWMLSPAKAQWCCLDSALVVRDLTTANLRLLISGAQNNDLSSAGQGICGVRIRFNHSFVGDLTVDLISPSGQRVRLLGPAGNSGKTDFSKWNVAFVPCGETAIPDPGFKPKWDNEQNWGIFGRFYSGTYYPFLGCLEDFNTGSVNGIWTLAVTDNERFYEGAIQGFCLLFCDQTGINCSDCSPNGGVFANAQYEFCEADPALNIADRVSFPLYQPDTALYSFTYLITRGDQMIRVGNDLNMQALPGGDYTICGLSYLKSDSAKLPKAGELYSVFQRDLVVNGNGFCAELSKNCLNITIHPVYPNTILPFRICRGDQYVFGTDTFSMAGVYNLPLKSVFGCDSLVELNLDIVDMDIRKGPVDTIDCSTPRVQLDISGSSYSSKSRILWTTQNGVFSDLTDSLKPWVSEGGTYKVYISDGFCSDSAEFTVIKIDQLPELTIRADSLNCFQRTGRLWVQTNANVPRYRWSDGNMDIGADSLININQAGSYFITVTDRNGCSNIGSIEMRMDTAIPVIQLSSGTLNCRDTLVSLNVQSDRMIIRFDWSGPDQFSSSLVNPIVRTAGRYNLAVQAENGCEATGNIEVISDATIPDFSYEPDTLNCRNGMLIAFRARSTSVLDTIRYTDPKGVFYSILNPEFRDPGWYQLRLVDTGGCTLDTSFQIAIDSATVRFSIQSDSLDCTHDSVQIRLDLLNAIPLEEIVWTSPSGLEVYVKDPYVRESGWYHLSVMASNGCVSVDSIFIFQDDDKPDIDLTSDTLDCNHPVVTVNPQVSGGRNFLWIGPLGFTDTAQNIQVRIPGVYRLQVTAANGCSSERTIDVQLDTIAPIQGIRVDTITCVDRTADIELLVQGSVDSISWMGPQSFVSANRKIQVDFPGWYVVFVRGANGCLVKDSALLIADTLPPGFSLIGDTLNCIRQQIDLMASLQDSASHVEWRSSSGLVDTTARITVRDSGWYRFVAVGRNGCLSTDSILVVSRMDIPQVVLTGDTITCKHVSASIGLRTMETGLRYDWTGPGSFQSSDSLIQVGRSGWYQYSVTNRYGCSYKDSFLLLDFLQKPVVQYSDPLINCLTKLNPELRAATSDSLVFYEWILPSGSRIRDTVISAMDTGIYVFIAENRFGCIQSDSIRLLYDTTAPRFVDIFWDSLSCLRQHIIPIVDADPPMVNYLWNGPSGFVSNLPNPLLNRIGSYRLRITAANFCWADTTLELTKDSSLPVFQLTGAVITCASDSAQLLLTSLDSLKAVSWQSPSGTIYQGRNPMVRDTGWFVVVVTGINDCLVVDSVYVALDRQSPVVQVDSVGLPCVPDSVQLLVRDSKPANRYLWSGNNGFSSTLKNPFVRDTGWYVLIVTAANQCTTRITSHVSDLRSVPALKAAGGVLNCRDRQINLQAVFAASGIRFVWSGPSGLDSLNRQPVVDRPGIYRISITDEFGCSKDTAVQVVMDTIAPVFQLSALDELVCEQKLVRLLAGTSCANCQYRWYSRDGSMIGQTNRDTQVVEGPGTYFLELTDPVNGCQNRDSLVLKESNRQIESVSLLGIPPECYGERNGKIQIGNVNGGTGPYELSTDGVRFGSVADLDGLSAGIYRLYFRDSNGCLLDTLVELTEPAELQLKLGNDTTIQKGNSLILTPKTNADTSRLRMVEWLPASDLNCPSCFTVIAKPLQPIRYVLKITDEFGCMAEDDIFISLIVSPNLYIPNAFSPNQDQINDFLVLVSGDGPVEVLQLRLFDRWGNQLVELRDFVVDGTFPVWDGSVDGRPVNPGVYVFLIQTRLADGQIFLLRGDLTLVK